MQLRHNLGCWNLAYRINLAFSFQLFLLNCLWAVPMLAKWCGGRMKYFDKYWVCSLFWSNTKWMNTKSTDMGPHGPLIKYYISKLGGWGVLIYADSADAGGGGGGGPKLWKTCWHKLERPHTKFSSSWLVEWMFNWEMKLVLLLLMWDSSHQPRHKILKNIWPASL